MSTAASRAAEKVEAEIRERYGMEIDVHFGPTTPYSVTTLRVRICRRCASLVASVEEHDAWHREARPLDDSVLHGQGHLVDITAEIAPLGWVADSAGPFNGHRPARPGEPPIPGSVPVVRFKVGDLVRYADFQPMKVVAVHDSHGLYYETAWPENNDFAGNYVHEDLRAVDGSGPGEVGLRA